MQFYCFRKKGFTRPFPSPMKRMAGFTLIELMVGVAIIGILASVVFAGLGEARKKARDAQRMSDLQQVQLALRLYKDVHGTYPVNPGVNDGFGGDNIYYTELSNLTAVGGALSGYFSGGLVDPSGSPYYYNSAYNCGGSLGVRSLLYIKEMEKSENANKNQVGCQDGEITLGESMGENSYILILK